MTTPSQVVVDGEYLNRGLLTHGVYKANNKLLLPFQITLEFLP